MSEFSVGCVMAFLKRALRITGIAAVILALFIVLAVAATQTAWFRERLRYLVIRESASYLNGQLQIDRLDGNLFGGLQLRGVSIRQDGVPVVAADDISLDYSLGSLISGGIVIDEIALTRPVVVLKRQADGWNLAHLLKQQASEEGQRGPGRPLAIRKIVLENGRVVIQDKDSPVSEINDLHARLGLAYAPVKLELTIDRLGFEVRPANLSVRAIVGKVGLEGDDLHLNGIDIATARSDVRFDGVLSDYASGTPRINATLTSRRLSPAEFGSIVPALARVDVTPAVNVNAEGPLDALAVGFDVRSNAGDLSGRMTLDATAPTRAVKGTLDTRQLDLAPFLGDPAQRTRITGRLTLDLRVPSPDVSATRGRFAFDSPQTTVLGYAASGIATTGTVEGATLRFDGKATAYGAGVTTKGQLVLPVEGRQLTYSIAGDVVGLDLRNLPRSLGVPRLESLIAGHYMLKGAPGSIAGAIRLRPSELVGARLGDGTEAGVILRGRRLEYSAAGSVTGLDIERLGAELHIAVLAQDRYASDLNGSFDVRGSGRTLADLELRAAGRFTNSSLDGARLPALAVDVTLLDRALRAGVRGDFARFDPGALGIARLSGSDLNGSADVTIRLANIGGEFSLADMASEGSVRLRSSTVAGLVVDQADLRGSFADRTVRLDLFSASGPALAASASGVLALNETTASDLRYHLEAPDLAAIGKMLGTPMAGTLTVDGSASGLAADFTTRGTLRANRLRYGTSVEALTLTSEITVRLPDFDPARVAVDADTEAGFVRAGGQDIQRLTASTKYARQQLDFEATVEAGPRSLAAGGRLLVHQDHREIHLAALSLGTEGMTWSLPANTEAVVQYGGQTLRVHDLVVERGPQKITIEGAVPIGQPAEGQPPTIASGPAQLDLKVEHLQLADVDRLMLGDNRIGGEVNATASLSGTLAAPTGNAEFSIVNGNVRGTTFESLAGKVDLHEQRLGLDVTLDQRPGQGVTARGDVPLSALRSQPAAGQAPPAAPAEAGNDSMDVHVQTTRLDLALLEGLTTAVKDVRGVAEADVHVIGTLADPHLQGHITISDGAFTPAATGAAYSGLDAQLSLEPDRVLIENLRLVDDDGDPLTMSGALAVHEKTVGDVDVRVTSSGFELIDNELGDLDADVNLRLTGTITHPRIEGELMVDSGRIEADRVLALATSGGTSPAPSEPTTLTDEAIVELERLPERMRHEAAAAPVATSGVTAATPSPTATSAAGTAPTVATADGSPRSAATAESGGSALDRLAMNVRLRVPDDLVVRGQDLRTASSGIGLGDLNVTLGGDLRLEKAANEAGGPAMTGTVNVVRGFYEFQGRRFEVVRDSELRFGGFRPINPSLRIDAEREISGVIAKVHLRGTMRRPQLNLTSEPPLDPADVLSLVVFNAPINELGSSERVSLTERAGALAAGFVADPLTRSLGRALDVDYFEVRASGSRGEPSVGVGEQIGDKLFVRFEQQFGSDQVSQLQFEYRLADFVRLVTSVAEGGGLTSRSPTRRVEAQAVDLIFQWSY